MEKQIKYKIYFFLSLKSGKFKKFSPFASGSFTQN